MNIRGLLLVSSAAVLLSGCASGLLGGGGNSNATPQVPVGNNLAMPPDLALRAPGNTVDGYQPNNLGQDSIQSSDVGGVYGAAAKPKGQVPSTVGAMPRGTQGDPYEAYGISKLKADGTKKTDWELREELRQAVIAKKRQQNPRYGTVFNIGNVFKDE